MRRIASILLSFMLVISMIPALVYAEDDTTALSGQEVSGAVEYEVESETPDAGEEAPETLQISVVTKDAGLFAEWNDVRGAESYELYRSYSASSGWTLLAKGITALSYHDLKVASGKKAYYKVRACKADGSYSDYSEAASGIIYRVWIETGHGTGDDGRWDPGCIWGKYQEARLMGPEVSARKRSLCIY